MSRNDDAWNEIFSKLHIVEEIEKRGFFDLNANEIKSISNREPRLLAKMDFREQLPKVMRNEGLAVLAIANGIYRIGRFDPFIPIEKRGVVKPKFLSLPRHIISLSSTALTTESAALDAALLSGMLTDVFGESVSLTIRGRARFPSFEFNFATINFPISGVQIEVDGGYEGIKTINLIEAKLGSPHNINMRQILYPQLAWEAVARGRNKIVRSFLLLYQEPYFRFIPILFDKPIPRVDCQRESVFRLEKVTTLDIRTIAVRPYRSTMLSHAPFPQADRFDTVLAMFGIISSEGEVEKDELIGRFDLDPRQIDYYLNAVRWLGLAEPKEKGKFALTKP